MARLEIQWVTFIVRTRISSASSEVGAIAMSDSTKLYLGRVEGLPVVVVEDSALPFPATVPWGNVSGVGWVSQPEIEYVTAAEPSPAKKTAAKAGKFQALP